MASLSPIAKIPVSGTTALPQKRAGFRIKALWRLLALAAVIAVVADVAMLSLLHRSAPLANSALLPKDPHFRELRALAAEHPEDKDLHLALAQTYLKTRLYLSARAEFDLALQDHADVWETLSGRVAANTALERFDLAQQDLKRLLDLRPRRLETYLTLAEAYQQTDDIAAARQTLQRVPRGADGLPQVEGDPLTAADLLATAYSHLEDWQTALALVQRCLDQQPQRPASRVEKGRALAALGHAAEAIPLLEEGIGAAPQNADLQVLLGAAYQKRHAAGDQERAFHCFQNAALANGRNGAAVLAFARECDRKRYLPAAAFAYQRAAELGMEGGKPMLRSGDLMLQMGNKEEGWYRRGRYYEMDGDTDKALAEYKHLTALHSCRSGYLHLARVYSLRREPKATLACLLKAQRLDPGRAKQLQWLLAQAYSADHQEAKEMALLNQIVAAGGKDAEEACYQMSGIAKAGGKQDEAEAWVKRAIAANPNEADYHIELGLLLLERRSDPTRLQAAIDHLEKAALLSPDNYRAVYNLGLAYTYAGNLGEAVLALRHAVDLQPENGTGYHALALALQRAGDTGESREMEGMFHRYEDFKQARETLEARYARDSSKADVPRRLADFHLRAGEITAAVEYYQKYLALQPGDHAARQRLAEALGSLGRREEQQTQLAILAGHDRDKIESALVKAADGAHE